jgi:hypothetical protein
MSVHGTFIRSSTNYIRTKIGLSSANSIVYYVCFMRNIAFCRVSSLNFRTCKNRRKAVLRVCLHDVSI